MLTAIQDYFDRQLANRPPEPEVTAEHRARLAAAALLVEVVRSDGDISETERQALLGSVQRRFDLDPGAAQQLLALAAAEARDAHDLYQFTSRINATCTPERKVRLIEELWRAAYADAVLHKHEEHLIRRIAGLLHVPHSRFITTKLRVLESLNGVIGPRR